MKNKEPVQYRAAGGVRYEFKRKRVKNINLRVRADGSVAVSAPLGRAAGTGGCIRGRTGSMDRGGARARSCARARKSSAPVPCPGGCAGSVHTGKRCGISVVCTGAERAAPVLKVRQMKTRWGVCVPAKRQITFSLRLAEKPRAAVEYVVLHEYAHFVRADHSPAFWAVVARYMPGL